MNQNTFPRVENVNGQDCLIVALPLQQPTISETGKSYIIAKATWQKTNYVHNDKKVTVNGMAIISAK